MKAVAIREHLSLDAPEVFHDLELPTPEATGRDLLVRVEAVSVNPVDTKVRGPKDRALDEPRVLGWDAAGVVEAVGDDVSLFEVGDEVYYAGVITRPGCDSELHLVDERIVGHKPKRLSFEEAAAMPLTTLTAWEALFDRLGLPQYGPTDAPDETLLIIGGAGGVGSIATQIAKEVAGVRVIATASRDESEAWCREMGADLVIDHTKPFADEFERVGVEHADYVFCCNSTGEHFQNMVDVIKPQGRICTIVETKEPLPISKLQSKSAAFLWELMFTRPMFETPDVVRQHEILDEAARLFDAGTLRTTHTQSFGPLRAETLRDAHAQIETGRTIGKVTLGGIE